MSSFSEVNAVLLSYASNMLSVVQFQCNVNNWGLTETDIWDKYNNFKGWQNYIVQLTAGEEKKE